MMLRSRYEIFSRLQRGMEFWLVSEGEKEGPILDFELRSRIRNGDVSAEQKVWYADLEEWTPIGEVELFVNEFEKVGVSTVTEENVEGYLSRLEEEMGEKLERVPSPPPMPVEIHLWRRFGARWFDYLAYLAIFYSLVVLADIDLQGLQRNLLFPFVMILPWVFLESAALHFWGTTPGKWLTGLKVSGPHSQKLSAGASFLRTIRVMILGMGFAQPLLREICHLVALWFAVKKKVVLWDTPVGNRVVRISETPAKWVTFGVGVVAFLVVIMLAAYQIGLSQMTPEQLQDFEERKRAIEEVFGQT